jgi:hypothetical protein
MCIMKKIRLTAIFDHIFHKMETPILVGNAFIDPVSNVTIAMPCAVVFDAHLICSINYITLSNLINLKAASSRAFGKAYMLLDLHVSNK